MNETIKTLCSRASCRSFRGEQISISELREVLAAGSHAPSGMNRHSARAVAVQDPDKINLLSQLNASVMGGSGDPFYGAPTVIVVMADSSVPTYIEDASLAIGNMLNAAYSARSRLMLDSPCEGGNGVPRGQAAHEGMGDRSVVCRSGKCDSRISGGDPPRDENSPRGFRTARRLSGNCRKTPHGGSRIN